MSGQNALIREINNDGTKILSRSCGCTSLETFRAEAEFVHLPTCRFGTGGVSLRVKTAMRALSTLIVVLTVASVSQGQIGVEQIVRSGDRPAITIKVDTSLGYLGKTALDVEGLAKAEQYWFGEVENGILVRAFIVHFEHFNDDNKNIFRYPQNRLAKIGNHQYTHNVWAQPGFDMFELPEVAALLRKRGIQAGRDWLLNRYVRVVDKHNKAELILFYIEPLGNFGEAVRELAPRNLGVKSAGAQQIDAEMVKRANAAFTLARG